MLHTVFRKTVSVFVLLVLVCALAVPGLPAAAGESGAEPDIIMKVDTRFAEINQEICYSYQAVNYDSLGVPYVQWRIHEWKNGVPELADYALLWFGTDGPVLGTDGRESYTVKDPEVEAVTVETRLIDYNQVIRTRQVVVLIGTVPKAVNGLIADGSAQKLVTAGAVKNGTVYYALTAGKTQPSEDRFSAEIPAATGAGTYYVWYKPVSKVIDYDIPAACVSVTVLDPSTAVRRVTVSGGVYQLDLRQMTATLIKPKNRNAKKLTIPATVSANNTDYRVTAVKAKACRGMKKLTTLVIGENVTGIGASAFENCKKLKTITVKTAALTAKSVGRNAFKTGYPKKTTVRCPKAKINAYKKILIKKGLSKKNTKFTK